MEPSSVSGIPSATDNSVEALTKYKNIAYKLKKVLESTQIELKEKTAQLHALQDPTSNKDNNVSLLSELASYYENLPSQQSSSVSVPPCSISIVARVPFLNHTWLLLMCPTDGRTEWREEHTVLNAYPFLTNIITNTPVWVNPQERQTLLENTKEAQEQLRVFRVRAEALLRQRDTELLTLKQKIQQNRTDRIIGSSNNNNEDNNTEDNDGNTSNDMDNGRFTSPSSHTGGKANGNNNTPAVEKLLRVQADLRERESKAKDTVQQLSQELTKVQEQLQYVKTKYNLSHDDVPPALLSSSVFTTATAPLSSVSSSPSVLPSSPSATVVPSSSPSSSLTIDQISVKKLEEEYTAYRKRAVGIIKQRDEQIEKLNEEIEEVRNKLRNQQYLHQQQQQQNQITTSSVTSPATNTMSSPHPNSSFVPPPSSFSPGGSDTGYRFSSSGVLSPSTGSIDAKLQYLRKLLVKYLSSTDPSVRLSLETAIMAVAELSPADVLLIKRVQQENDPATAVVAAVSNAADLVGGWLTSTGLFGNQPTTTTGSTGNNGLTTTSSTSSATVSTPGAQRQLQFATLKQ